MSLTNNFIQVSKVQYDKIWGYIESGKAQGAKLVLGGQKRPGKGFFVDPTSKQCSGRIANVPRLRNHTIVFTDIKQDMKIVSSTLMCSGNSADTRCRSGKRYLTGYCKLIQTLNGTLDLWTCAFSRQIQNRGRSDSSSK